MITFRESVQRALAAGWSSEDIARMYCLRRVIGAMEAPPLTWLLTGMMLMKAGPEVFSGMLSGGGTVEALEAVGVADQFLAAIEERKEVYQLLIERVRND